MRGAGGGGQKEMRATGMGRWADPLMKQTPLKDPLFTFQREKVKSKGGFVLGGLILKQVNRCSPIANSGLPTWLFVCHDM